MGFDENGMTYDNGFDNNGMGYDNGDMGYDQFGGGQDFN
tara:strand:+ start:821 stop:937 length:117 start_codon:yes stop_codon:yes gene_type:complete